MDACQAMEAFQEEEEACLGVDERACQGVEVAGAVGPCRASSYLAKAGLAAETMVDEVQASLPVVAGAVHHVAVGHPLLVARKKASLVKPCHKHPLIPRLAGLASVLLSGFGLLAKQT